jgi:hypothetical protein
MVGAPLLLLLLLGAEDKPSPKFPLGKETTYVTGPLDKEGYIDYEAALNDQFGKGITPQNNANVLLWKALGPRPEGGERVPAEFFRRLGIEEPPERGDYLIDLKRYIKDHLQIDPDESDAIYDQHSRAGQRPWTAKEFPHIATWLKANEKPLAVAVDATKRPAYFNPLIASRTEEGRGVLIGALLPGVHKCRELANALAARAMLRVGEGKFAEAWQDLLACHRLGRLVARGATLVEPIVGIAIDSRASTADLAYLDRAKQSSKQLQERLNDLQGLPPLPPIADKIDFGERLIFLDSLQMISRGRLDLVAGGRAKKPNPEQLKAQEPVWETALRTGNRWYDRKAAALRLEDRAARNEELAKIAAHLKALNSDAAGLANAIKLIQKKDPPDKVVGNAIGDAVICRMMPNAGKLQEAYDRTEQAQRNLQIAFALAGYHRHHGRYPATLDDLAPKYLAAVPNDLFSGKSLIYRPSEKGYLFYSVGVNGIDEGGRSYDDNPRGDDLSVRMPLPELKQKK